MRRDDAILDKKEARYIRKKIESIRKLNTESSETMENTVQKDLLLDE